MNLTERSFRPRRAAVIAACAALLAGPLAWADDGAPATGNTTAPGPSSVPESAPPASTAPAPSSYGTDPVTGAPLGSSGVRQQVHVLQPTSSLGGKFEIAATIAAQVNTKFTQTAGDGLELEYHLADPIGIVLGGTYFWQSQPTPFTESLPGQAGQLPSTPEQISAQWEGHLALEFQPIYAKMAVFNAVTVHWGFYVSAGAGVAGTVIEVVPASPGVSRFTGNTGLTPEGYFNAGFRLVFGDHVALKLEVRDIVFSGYANTIDGCSQSDLAAIGNGSPSSASSSCQKAFSGTGGRNAANLGATLLTDTSTETINDLQFAAAISVIF